MNGAPDQSPRPSWELTALPTPIAKFKGLTSKRRKKREKEGEKGGAETAGLRHGIGGQTPLHMCIMRIYFVLIFLHLIERRADVISGFLLCPHLHLGYILFISKIYFTLKVISTDLHVYVYQYNYVKIAAGLMVKSVTCRCRI